MEFVTIFELGLSTTNRALEGRALLIWESLPLRSGMDEIDEMLPIPSLPIN